MQENKNALQAALERAAATLRNSGSNVGSGSGLFAPMDFGGPGMFNQTPMASQSQPGMQPTPNAQVADRFGGMAPPTQPTANQYVAQNFPPYVASSVPMPTPRPQATPQAAAAPMPSSPANQPGDSNMFRNHSMAGALFNAGGLFNPNGFQGTNSTGGIIGAQGPTSVGGTPLVQPQQPQQQDQGGLIQKMLGYPGKKHAGGTPIESVDPATNTIRAGYPSQWGSG